MAQPVTSPARKASKQAASVITSHDNRWLKRFRAALAGERGDDGFVGVEGVRLVEAALGSGLTVEALLLSDSGARHLPRVARVLPSDVPVLQTSDRLFAGIADTRAPQGMAALVRPRQATVESLLPGITLVVALVGVQDPGNVGTIVRTAEAFGASGVATCAAEFPVGSNFGRAASTARTRRSPHPSMGTADPFGPKALRASAGSALRLPIVHGISSTILLAQLRIHRVNVYAAVAGAEERAPREGEALKVQSRLRSPWEIDWTEPAALLIGNEGAGLSPDLVRAADARVCIPHAASTAPVGIESLNAAMAASVLLYEAMRQRNALRSSRP